MQLQLNQQLNECTDFNIEIQVQCLRSGHNYVFLFL